MTSHPDITGPTGVPGDVPPKPQPQTKTERQKRRDFKKAARPSFVCDRCERRTFRPLTNGECSVCVARGPDITPEEIARRAKEIRAEWGLPPCDVD